MEEDIYIYIYIDKHKTHGTGDPLPELSAISLFCCLGFLCIYIYVLAKWLGYIYFIQKIYRAERVWSNVVPLLYLLTTDRKVPF